MRRAWSIAPLLLAGCAAPTGEEAPSLNGTAPELETAAIAAAVIPNPASADLTGLYARDTDRVCVVPAPRGFLIGIFVDYGDQQQCSATGTVSKSGETLSVSLAGAPGCSFDARFEGDRIVLPGALPEGCAKLCSGRASMAALDVGALSDSISEAQTLRNSKGRLLCAPDQ